MSARMEWSGVGPMRQKMLSYEDKVKAAITAVANYWKAVFERYAKEEAPWTDRTANARQSLHAWVEEKDDLVTLYLSHGMEYGKFLEGAHAGRYAIIWPTIEAHLTQIAKMLKGIFG